MMRTPNREHDYLRVMIEQMQREGRPENAIHEAVRQARQERPERRPRRFDLFGRGRRRG